MSVTVSYGAIVLAGAEAHRIEGPGLTFISTNVVMLKAMGSAFVRDGAIFDRQLTIPLAFMNKATAAHPISHGEIYFGC
jgi:hypothetical protein